MHMQCTTEVSLVSGSSCHIWVFFHLRTGKTGHCLPWRCFLVTAGAWHLSPWMLSTLLPGKDCTSLFPNPHRQCSLAHGQSLETKTSGWDWEPRGTEGIGGRCSLLKLSSWCWWECVEWKGSHVPPEWAILEQRPAVSLSVPVGTAMECWGSVWKVFLGSLGGGRGGTGDRRKGHKQLAPTSPVEKHTHESGLLGIVDVCAGCQRRDCCVRNGKGVMEKSLCRRKNKKTGRGCCVEANGSKDKPVMLKSWVSLLNQCKALAFPRTALLTSETKAEGVMRNRARKWKLPPSMFGHP